MVLPTLLHPSPSLRHVFFRLYFFNRIIVFISLATFIAQELSHLQGTTKGANDLSELHISRVYFLADIKSSVLRSLEDILCIVIFRL
jgi:hypothetical protein